MSSSVPDELYVNSLVNALGTLLQTTVLNVVLMSELFLFCGTSTEWLSAPELSEFKIV